MQFIKKLGFVLVILAAVSLIFSSIIILIVSIFPFVDPSLLYLITISIFMFFIFNIAITFEVYKNGKVQGGGYARAVSTFITRTTDIVIKSLTRNRIIVYKSNLKNSLIYGILWTIILLFYILLAILTLILIEVLKNI